MKIANKLILAGDVGGTKTYLAVFSQQDGLGSPVAEDIFPSKDFSSFFEMVQGFLGKYSLKPATACIGVAGPVLAGAVKITKLGWHISEAELKTTLGLEEALLLNDLVATGHAIPFMSDGDLLIINPGVAEIGGVKIVVAPGTGLGETFITGNSEKYTVHASEGGHTLFAPQTPLQLDLLRYALGRYEQVTFDLLCSGRGISIIYDFLRERSDAPEPDWLTTKLQQTSDRTPGIVEAAHGVPKKDQISNDTVRLFVDILASECANFAVKTMASGGVYLAGGIPGRISSFLEKKMFMAAFSDRPPLENYLANIPVTIITKKRAALLGAASVALHR